MGEKKPVMISLAEQLKRDRFRLRAKQEKRKGKPFRMPIIRLGNKDFGVPYRGKDTFSGMFKKFEDRFVYGFVYVYDNNKYNANGTLKN